MASYLITEPAEIDLDEILIYIADDNPEAAIKLINSILERFQKLAEFPKSGRERENLYRDSRSFPEGNYLIFYRLISTGQIEILRVLHSARDLEEIFS